MLSERLARPEDPHAGVAGGYVGPLRKVLHGQPVDLDGLQCVGILVLQRGRELAHTVADRLLQLRFGLGVRLDLELECSELSSCCAAATPVVFTTIR